MARTGIWQLAVLASATLVLAGCEQGAKPSGQGGDPAAKALTTEEISSVSLDDPAIANAASDPSAATGPAAAGSQDIAAGATAASAAASAGAGAATDIAATEAKPARPRKGLFGFLGAKPAEATPQISTETGAAPTEGVVAAAAKPGKAVRLGDRDVEAPGAFQVTDEGLWDGRPSLGGVWVAHPDVTAPERVIIRNTSNGSFVVGALFRRERENPGPKFQISSDAAEALGMLAGAPATVQVTALRREEVAAPAETQAASAPIKEEPLAPAAAVATTAAAAAAEGTAEAAAIGAAGATATAAAAELPAAKQPGKFRLFGNKNRARREAEAAAAAAASLDSAGQAPAVAEATAPAPADAAAASGAAAPAAAVAPAGGASYLQVGIYSQEANATEVSEKLRAAGLTATIQQGIKRKKPVWRVIAGTANTPADQQALLEKAKAAGFADAYFVTQ